MKKLLKKILKKITPRFIRRKIQQKNSVTWSGDYQNWTQVQALSSGYNQASILDKVYASALKVRRGEAVYERDSVIFDEIEYSWSLLSGLMFAAANAKGRLSVLDFGGALGSSYFQNRKFFKGLDVKWGIVEQPHFVNIGKKEFCDDILDFFESIELCVQKNNPNVLVLSSVLQYMELPYQKLEQLLLAHAFDVVIIDITPMAENTDRLTLQKVPKSIYEASYPCWMLNKQKIDEIFVKAGYELVERFLGYGGYQVKIDKVSVATYCGEIRKKK